MTTQPIKIEKSPRRRLFLPTLILANFTIWTISTLFGLVLVDIAAAFHVTVGTASQIPGIARLLGILVGVLMSMLSIRFRNKSLFIGGLAIFTLGAFGIYWSSSFTLMTVFYAVNGAGAVIVGIMAWALIGEFLSLEKRGGAAGWWLSMAYVEAIIAAPVMSYIAVMAGWRSVVMGFIFPLSVACVVLCYVFIPSKPNQEQITANVERPTTTSYLKAFRSVLLDKSAVACLVNNMLVWAQMQIFVVFMISFFRLQFSMSLGIAGLVTMAGGIIGASVTIIGGRFVNRVGRKTLGVFPALIGSAMAISFTFMPNMWASVAVMFVGSIFGGLSWPGLYSLSLEQVPGFKGTMMSFNSTFKSIGVVLGITIGGIVLNLYNNNFQALSLILGGLGVGAAIVLFAFAKDPCKTKPQS